MSNIAKDANLANQRNIVTLSDAKPGNEREKGRIQEIVSSIKSEPGFFFSSDYVAKYPPATVQGILSILKAAGVITSVAGQVVVDGKPRMERGKYIRTEVMENVALIHANERIKQLEAQLASLR